jgi:HAD superfamily hydrolase (TIGR01484 family)
MRLLGQFPAAARSRIRFVLTDVDDTLTDGPRLPAAAYAALERLYEAGLTVIPVTAAPAGWCDAMARMWPVAAIIGENGGLCFRRDPQDGQTERRYWLPAAEVEQARGQLAELALQIVAAVPGAVIAHDQRYRETTLAFVNPSDAAQRNEILMRMAAAGLDTTANSLWVLGWRGGFDKLAMTRRMLAQLFAVDIEHEAESCIYVGDSLNDDKMFGFFPHSVGVATVRSYLDRLAWPPRWVTSGGGGAGFVEVAEMLLGAI